jgi:hypothetical protein
MPDDSPAGLHREGNHMQLAMSIGLIVAGLFLALIVDYQNDGSEMRLFGWVLVAMGLLGIVLRLLIPLLRRNEGGR